MHVSLSGIVREAAVTGNQSAVVSAQWQSSTAQLPVACSLLRTLGDVLTPSGENYQSVYLNLPSSLSLSLSFFFGAVQVFLKEALEQRLEKEREEVRTAAGMVIRAHILSYVARLVQLCVCLCINTLC